MQHLLYAHAKVKHLNLFLKKESQWDANKTLNEMKRKETILVLHIWT